MIYFRFINTIAFWQLLLTVIITSIIGFPLIFLYCDTPKNRIYIIVPMISVVVASIAYFLNRVDKTRSEIKVSISTPKDDEEAEYLYGASITASDAYLIDPKLKEINNYKDNIKNEERSKTSIFVSIYNESKASKMTLEISTKLKEKRVNKVKVLNPGTNLIIVLRSDAKLKVKYFNHKVYCRKERQVINE